MINFISNADLDQQVTLEVKANLPKFIFENTTLFKTEEGWNGQCFNGGLLFTRDDFIFIAKAFSNKCFRLIN